MAGCSSRKRIKGGFHGLLFNKGVKNRVACRLECNGVHCKYHPYLVTHSSLDEQKQQPSESPRNPHPLPLRYMFTPLLRILTTQVARYHQPHPVTPPPSYLPHTSQSHAPHITEHGIGMQQHSTPSHSKQRAFPAPAPSGLTMLVMVLEAAEPGPLRLTSDVAVDWHILLF